MNIKFIKKWLLARQRHSFFTLTYWPVLLLLAAYQVTVFAADQDGDGIANSADNCIEIANPLQRDSNGDGYGNICDADLDGNLIVNAADFVLLRNMLNSQEPDADLNGDGVVNAADFIMLRNQLNNPPGPSCCEQGIQIILDDLKAFPTAEGAGAGATGGRFGEVVYVTNKNPKQEGSLDYALTHRSIGDDGVEMPRTVVFAIGGEFMRKRGNLQNDGVFEFRHHSASGNLTIAGQTANDIGGVHFTTEEDSDSVEKILAGTNGKDRGSYPYYSFRGENFIIRYISARGRWNRFKVTYEERGVGDKGTLFDMQISNNAIFDHFTGGWSSYCMLFNKYNESTEKVGTFTFQKSLCVEGIDLHQGANSGHNVSTVTGFPMSNANDLFNDATREERWNNIVGEWDFHHNAFILNGHRQPSNTSGGKNSKFGLSSNYIYGWTNRLARHGGNAQLDMVNNVFEKGNYDKTVNPINLFKASFNTPLLGTNNSFRYQPSIFVAGNIILQRDGNIYLSSSESVDEQFSKTYTYFKTTENYGTAGSELDSDLYQRESPQNARLFAVSLTPAENVKKTVLQNVGAGVRFNIDGTFKENADSIDRKYIGYTTCTIEQEQDQLCSPGPSDKNEVGDHNHFIKDDYDNASHHGELMLNGEIDLSSWDSDLDGMPNDWEIEQGLDPNTKNNNHVEIGKTWKIGNYHIVNNAGYTDLEIYLADIAGDFHMLANQ